MNPIEHRPPGMPHLVSVEGLLVVEKFLPVDLADAAASGAGFSFICEQESWDEAAGPNGLRTVNRVVELGRLVEEEDGGGGCPTLAILPPASMPLQELIRFVKAGGREVPG